MLSAYQLACGYTQRLPYLDKISILLWKEHGVYHVRVYDHENSKRLSWESFRLLKDARKEFANQKRKLQYED